MVLFCQIRSPEDSGPPSSNPPTRSKLRPVIKRRDKMAETPIKTHCRPSLPPSPALSPPPSPIPSALVRRGRDGPGCSVPAPTGTRSSRTRASNVSSKALGSVPAVSASAPPPGRAAVAVLPAGRRAPRCHPPPPFPAVGRGGDAPPCNVA